MKDAIEKSKRLDANYFDYLHENFMHKSGPERIAIARRVFVDGERPSDVAEELEISRTAMTNTINLVLKYYRQDRDIANNRKALSLKGSETLKKMDELYS